MFLAMRVGEMKPIAAMISAGTIVTASGAVNLTSGPFLLIPSNPVLKQRFQGSPGLPRTRTPKLARPKARIQRRPGSGEDLEARDGGTGWRCHVTSHPSVP